MRRNRFWAFLGLILAAGVCWPSAAWAQFGNLTQRIPDRANALMLVDLEKAYASPLGTREGWRQKLEKAFSDGLVILPPQANQFALAAELDFESMRPKWEVAVMDLAYEPSVPKAAARFGGTVDNIEGEEAVRLRDTSYLVKFGPRIAAALAPATRQDVGRWINQVRASETGALSPYLKESIKYIEGNSAVILAVDLGNVTSPDEVRQRLTAAEAPKLGAADPAAVSQALASIRGVMLGITFGEVRYGKIKVDFQQDVSILRDLAKPLLLYALAQRGMMIEEFNDWTAKVSGPQVTLEGPLYESGMRRIMSILDAPAAMRHHLAEAATATPAETSSSLTLLSTQSYFKSVGSLLDDLRIKRTSTEFVTWGQVGAWFEKYARKIDRLPILNVDPEMLDYGAYVAHSLREAETAMKGIGANVGYRKTELPNYYTTQSWAVPVGVNWGGVYGVYGWRSQEDLAARGQAEAHIRTQERIRGNTSANLIGQGIESATADIRRRMTEKYKAEF